MAAGGGDVFVDGRWRIRDGGGRGRRRRRRRRRRRLASAFNEHVADQFSRLRVDLQHVGGRGRAAVVRGVGVHGGRLRRRPRRRGADGDGVVHAADAGAAGGAVVTQHVHRVGERHRLLAGRRDRTTPAVRARQQGRRLRGRQCQRLGKRDARPQAGDDGRVMFGRGVHAGLLDRVVQQLRAVRLQVEPQIERVVVVVQRRRVRQRVRLRPVDRELLDHHVPARVRYRLGRRARGLLLRAVERRRARAPVVHSRHVRRLVRRQWLRRAPAKLTVPLSFYLVLSFLLLLVLVQIVQHIMQHQIVTVLVLSLKHNVLVLLCKSRARKTRCTLLIPPEALKVIAYGLSAETFKRITHFCFCSSVCCL